MASEGPFIYRGTSSGWPGNPVLQLLRKTCASIDPYLAALFAIDCQRLGKGVILVCRRDNIEHLISHSNHFDEIEREVVVDVSPLEFRERFAELVLGVDVVRQALMAVGYELPAALGDKRALDAAIKHAPRLSSHEIESFNQLIHGDIHDDESM